MLQDAATVYIIDDDASVRKHLSRLIRSAGLEPRSFDSADKFLARRDWNRPACVLLDLSMPGMNGLALQDELRRRGKAMPIVFVSGRGSVPLATQAMKAGAVDFLEKPLQADRLVKVVGEALALDRRQCAQSAARAEVSARHATLTRREREVMTHVVRGRLNKQIAADLGISEKTVKIHRGRVMEKMAAESVPDLVRMDERVRPNETAT